jgi:hypothetical protein
MSKQPDTLTNTQELRRFLLDKMKAAANGELNSEQSRSITNFAQQVYNTLNIEVKVAALAAKSPDQTIKPVDFNG